MAQLVTAYRKDTGKAVQIPSDWLGHPVLGGPFTADQPSVSAPTDSARRPGGRRTEQPAAPVADEDKED